jgi:hypothetical protein
MIQAKARGRLPFLHSSGCEQDFGSAITFQPVKIFWYSENLPLWFSATQYQQSHSIISQYNLSIVELIFII